MPETQSLLDVALEYAKRGWRVFPCKNNKAPYTEHGFKDSSLDEEQIRAWWLTWPQANIGIETGVRSGLVVLDIDDRNGGISSIKKIIKEKGDFQKTLKAYTANGGYHCYFRYQADIPKRPGYAPGIDIQSDGGYVIAPPSKLSETKRYYWCNGCGPENELVDAPGWMAEIPQSKIAPPVTIGDVIREGERNKVLVSLAGAMRRKGASVESIYAAVSEENKKCLPPLPTSELKSIAISIGKYEPAEKHTVADEIIFWEWDKYADSASDDVSITHPEDICKYHISFLQDSLYGIFPGELVVIGADTGIGKTQVANDLAFYNALLKKQVYLFSLEGDRYDVIKREWHKRTVKYMLEVGFPEDMDISYQNFIMNIDSRMWQYRYAVKDQLLKDMGGFIHIYKNTQSLTIDRLTTTIRQIKDSADLVIIDHLHYFEFESDNEHAEITEILKSIRELISEYRIPIVLISHLRKKNKDRFLPDNEDFHGSSNIAKQADTCIVLSRYLPKGKEAELLTAQIETSVYPTAIRVTKNRQTRSASLAGIINFDGIRRKYEDKYELQGVGFQDFFELYKTPRWAKNAKTKRQDTHPADAWEDERFR